MPLTIDLIHESSLLDGLAKRWSRQYPPGDGTVSPRQHEIRNALEVATHNGTLTPESAAAIIGNDSWSFLRCDSCGNRAPVLAQIGGSEQPKLCHTCLATASFALSNELHWKGYGK